ncbi:Zinc-binding domain of primase-helicase [Desulfonatronum zhilinae]|nr:Zinc-binding domain of primase-helicase [Desulfonatronum zhilinae]
MQKNVIEILSYLEAEVGELTLVSSSGSYNSPCPLCGGEDRFGYTPDPKKFPEAAEKGGLFYCRQCKFKGNGETLLRYLKKGITYLPKNNAFHKESPSITTPRFQAPPESWQRPWSSLLLTYANTLDEKGALPLTERGITLATAKRYGLCPIPQRFPNPAADNSVPGQKYGPGIFIPARRNDILFKVEIRNFDPDSPAKYIIMPGSSVHPMIFNDQTNGSGTYMLIESLLDGYMLHSHVSDLVTPIAIGSTTTALDQETLDLLKKAKRILISLDNDQSGWARAMILKSQFPNSSIIIPPFGKDPGEFFQRGGDLRGWLETALGRPEQSSPGHSAKIQVKLCRNPETVSKYLAIIQAAEQPVAVAMKTEPIKVSNNSKSILGTQIKHLAFYFGEDIVIIFDMNKISIKQIAPIFTENMVTFNGVELLALLNKGKTFIKSIDSMMLMDNSVSNKPFKTEPNIESLAYLVGARPSKKSNTHDEELAEIAREAKLIFDLNQYFKNEIKTKNKNALYELMRNAQFAVSKMWSYGLLYNPGKNNDTYKRFVDPLSGRIPNTSQMSGTVTGRFTSSSPSLHNVQKAQKVRSRFITPEGLQFVIGDFSQIQLRIISELSQDRYLKNVFEQGIDLHLATAAAISNLPLDQASSYRSIAKTVNFGIVFGQTPKGLQESLSAQGIETTFEQAQEYQNAFFTQYPGVKTWIDNSVDSQNRDSRWKAVSPMGRERDLGWYASNKRRELINTPVQAAEAEILLATLALLPDLLEPIQARLIHTVHDEIILECLDAYLGQAQEALAQAMIQGFLTIFPNAATNNLVDITVKKTWSK